MQNNLFTLGSISINVVDTVSCLLLVCLVNGLLTGGRDAEYWQIPTTFYLKLTFVFGHSLAEAPKEQRGHVHRRSIYQGMRWKINISLD